MTAREASGHAADRHQGSPMAHQGPVTPFPQTGTGVVRSMEEAGHRMQEQQGADNPGAPKGSVEAAIISKTCAAQAKPCVQPAMLLFLSLVALAHTVLGWCYLALQAGTMRRPG